MSYQKLLLEYAQTLADVDKSIEGGQKRLRWEKDEAMGNSKFRWTGTKVRYAHVVNRSLQMNLDKNVSVWAKTHGSKCNEIEAKQREVWMAQKKRNSMVGSSYLNKQGKVIPKISEPLFYKRGNTRISCNTTPFSNASDFAIYRRPLDPSEQGRMTHEGVVTQRIRTRSTDSQRLSDCELSHSRICQSKDRRSSVRTLFNRTSKNSLLIQN